MARCQRRRVCWRASPSPDVAGYKLYWAAGEVVGYDSCCAEVGLRTEVILPDDIPALTIVGDNINLGVSAVTASGDESDIIRFSAPVRFDEPAHAAFVTKFSPVTASLVFAILVLLAVHLLFYDTPRKRPLLFPVTKHTVRPEISGAAKAADGAVYASLCGNEDPRGELFLLSTEQKWERGAIWSVTELLVKCSDEDSASRILRRLSLEISKLGSRADLRAETNGKDGMIGFLTVGGVCIYKIHFTFEPPMLYQDTPRPRIAIILDDLGYDWKIASSFMLLDLPLTLSVLPSAPFTDGIVREAHENGWELIAHLPMEPKAYPEADPGPEALFVDMEESEIRGLLDHCLMQIPGARGANNHMGSCFTEDRAKMRIVMEGLKQRNLFFVDSLTSVHTVGFEVAREMGLQAAKRDVFLDNDPSFDALKLQMDRLLKAAHRSGSAIAILHPHEGTLEILREYLPKITTEFEVVPVSELVS